MHTSLSAAAICTFWLIVVFVSVLCVLIDNSIILLCWLEWLSVANLPADGDASPSEVLPASTILPTSSSINRLIVTCFYFELYWANGDRDEAAGCTSSDPAPSPHHQYILSSCDTSWSSGIRHVLSCSRPG